MVSSRLWAMMAAVVCAAGPTCHTARAEAILTGPADAEPVATITLAYSTAAPAVVIGAEGDGIDIAYDAAAGPIVKVFQITSPVYHHLHIVEYLEVAGPAIHDWHQILMVPDGEGGWTPSGNYDDLWWSCRAGVTPWPDVTPAPSSIDVVNVPDDTLTVYWDEGLPDGTQIILDFWVTVPADLTTFAIFQYPTTPEPATAALLGLGLAALWRRRRHRSRHR